jgi:hypothetical protein
MMTPDVVETSSRILDGEGQRIGDLFWHRPDPPLLAERAELLASALPAGTLAAGVSAGWVWSGMGTPTPLSLIARSSPAPSPLARHRWKIRGIAVPCADVVVVRGLSLLTKVATVADLWTCDGSDEVAAAQLFWLAPASSPPGQPSGPPAEHVTNDRTDRRRAIIHAWRENYPWATR